MAMEITKERTYSSGRTRSRTHSRSIRDYEEIFVSSDREGQLLIPKQPPLYQENVWMFFHFLGFFTGGFTFIIGTWLYYFPNVAEAAEWSGWLYTIGSVGFLSVDVIEFFTFTDDVLLRINIFLSLTGSTFYVIGSIGFIPEVYNVTPFVGIWGFILGSLFIGVSQVWKTVRILSNAEKVNKDILTQIGVELDAGLGGWCFFVGTIMYLHGPLDGSFYQTILAIWIAGSCFFWTGSLFLGYRHGIMRV